MGSCLSGESGSPRAGSPVGRLKRRGSKRRFGSRSSSFDYRREEQLHRTPGRMFLNGSSDIASLFSQQGRKGTNQDAMIVWENFGSRTDTVFCGVFDGHGPYGHLVAKRVRDSLPLKLSAHWEVNIKSDEVLREVSLNTANSLCSEDTAFLSAEEESRGSVDIEETVKQPEIFQTLKESFLKAFKVMDRELKVHANIDCFCSGTTAVTLVKQGQDLIIGNIGDSRAVLATRDANDALTPVQLTVDLKPNIPAEADRIRKCRGRVFALHDEPEIPRVWLPNSDSPGLAMARAFGDFCLKDFGLISVPEVSYRRLTDRDEFIVLATDGIWDVLSNKEVVEIVKLCPSRAYAARSLVEAAVRSWRSKYPTSKVDDCAVVCLFLDSNESATAAGSKENTREEEDEEEEEEEGLKRCGTVREGGHEDEDEDTTDADTTDADADADAANLEIGQQAHECEWSALEGVSRVNTLLNLPRFVPGKDDIKARNAAN